MELVICSVCTIKIITGPLRVTHILSTTLMSPRKFRELGPLFWRLQREVGVMMSRTEGSPAPPNSQEAAHDDKFVRPDETSLLKKTLFKPKFSWSTITLEIFVT